jgi:catechol 2,3-dioxygenase-like lactoylglutathione lyase family enzyme
VGSRNVEYENSKNTAIGIVVNDLKAAIAFFAELGLELEGETTVEGKWVDRITALNDV